ncbi:rab-GTPase-TBC domain protein (macronuclear) [Tetrahymena thermophila SB210]|uniref:Rab-GTPase-TBC domain protein n=1 Tax=Tetrahymena thermophila (strain SB210) TaxID=312017 RepID=I7MJX3_TETTS|nr:rab-GTPase-TBC domain protein [Tetrahymena thermophila SB210]EAR97282.2 rab-GTPase-TBC domain protein [Tetrahymena thermophila SB210]|eukprot:XP_001017527.2 rab-GTPase-TBC domain protein [Tetrahymena thermophila SB210]
MEDSQNNTNYSKDNSSKSSFQSQETQQSQSEKQLLDWKKYLYDENTQIEVIKFKKWDRNLDFPDQQVLQRDLNRTRNSEEYFKKEKTQQNLQLIATFYCISNQVNYQQGMLDIIAPFLLLRSPTFKLPKCYAYFNAFMNKYFPEVLKARISDRGKSLPHANCSIALCKILLKYHSQKLSKLLVELDIDLSATVTQWILTMFSQGTRLDLVYLIYDEYLKRSNCNYIFYLAIGLILTQEEEIWNKYEEDQDSVIIFFNKKIKNLETKECVQKLFLKADQIKNNTPKSFEHFIDNIGFNDHSILSIEDIQNMLNLNLVEDMIPLYSQEIIESIENKKGENITFNLIDCRITTPDAQPFPNTIPFSLSKLSKSDKSDKYINDYSNQIIEFIKKNDPQQVNTHISFVINSIQTHSEIQILEKILKKLKENDIFLISLLVDSKKLQNYIQNHKNNKKHKEINNLPLQKKQNFEQSTDSSCILI